MRKRYIGFLFIKRKGCIQGVKIEEAIRPCVDSTIISQDMLIDYKIVCIVALSCEQAHDKELYKFLEWVI